MSPPVRLLLADDQRLVRGALAALLELADDLEVVAQVAAGDEVLGAVREHRPDVALLDIEMSGLDGITATRQVVAEGTGCRCLIVTTFGRPGYLRRAMEAGASGFVVKDTPAAQLAKAVRRVHVGLRALDPALAVESLAGGPNPLTVREQEVLRAAADGSSVKHVSGRLHMSPGTVRNHLSSAIGKTHTSNRSEACRAALENGWL